MTRKHIVILLTTAFALLLLAGVSQAGPPDPLGSPADESYDLAPSGAGPLPTSTVIVIPLDINVPAGVEEAAPVLDNQIVSYDPATGENTYYPIPKSDGLPQWADSSGFLSDSEYDLGGNDGVVRIQNFTALSKVSSPDVYPFRVNVAIRSTFERYAPGEFGGCSGTLIYPGLVLTAGHCVYSFDADACNNPTVGCWAQTVTVIPALDETDRPYGEAGLARPPISFAGWTQSRSWDWDMAWLILDRPVGALTGWHGFGYSASDDFYTDGDTTFFNIGYPGEPPYPGDEMYSRSGHYDEARENQLRFTRNGVGGMSGAGAYWLAGGSNPLGARGSLAHDGGPVGQPGQRRHVPHHAGQVQYTATGAHRIAGQQCRPDAARRQRMAEQHRSWQPA